MLSVSKQIFSSSVKFDSHPSYLGICVDRPLSFRTHLHTLKKNVSSRVALIKRLAGVGWGASFKALRTSCLALAFAPAMYCAPVWCCSAHKTHRCAFKQVDARYHWLPTKHSPLLLAHSIWHYPM